MRNRNRLIATIVALATFGAASSAIAVTNEYSLTGSWVNNTGVLIKIPVAGTIAPTAGARVLQQTGGTAPVPTLTMPPHIFTIAASPRTVPIPINPGLLELATNAPQVAPAQLARFSAGGRSGPATVSFCPGGTQGGKTIFSGSTPYNPNCTVSAAAPTGIGTINGIMVYKGTLNQFGGVGRIRSGTGSGHLAVLLAPIGPTGTPGQVLFLPIGTAAATQNPGMAFGQTNMTTVQPGNVYLLFGYTPGGLITNVGSVPVGTAPAGPPATAWGGPLTTGTVTIKKTGANAPPTFTLMGTDTRNASGVGNLVMVAGALVSSARYDFATLSMNLTNLPEPTAIAGTTAALIALAGCRVFTRRRSS